jgi:hypothetical protein
MAISNAPLELRLWMLIWRYINIPTYMYEIFSSQRRGEAFRLWLTNEQTESVLTYILYRTTTTTTTTTTFFIWLLQSLSDLGLP